MLQFSRKAGSTRDRLPDGDGSWDAAIAGPGSLTARSIAAARDVLAGRRSGLSARLAFVGPAVVASIAYIDPGNFATNVQAGAKYGYELLWVVLAANLIAMLFQALSAKLGIVTGRNLAEMCREQFPRPIVWAMWVISEIAAMATDLAEFLGGAIGLALLLGMPLLAGMVVTGILTYGILMFERFGFRPFELIIGATVMPHAVYLHSGLTQARTPGRDEAERQKLVRISNHEVVIALAVAGLVNMAMVIMASGAFHAGHSEVAQIETAYHTLTPLLGAGAAGVFLVSLLASGISSSAVGTMAGQLIMQGFVGFRIPVWVRRLVTM